MTSSVFAQGPHHGGGMHDLWPDTLATTQVTGTVIIDSTFFHPMYYLDEKDYVNRPALDLTGEALPSGDLRRDRQILTWFSLSKSFMLPGGKSLNVTGEFYWIDNQSNDLYYQYQVSSVLLSIGTSF
ncbi:MAG: hypothetical protein ACE5G1_05940 [bacterium]